MGWVSLDFGYYLKMRGDTVGSVDSLGNTGGTLDRVDALLCYGTIRGHNFP